MQLNNLTYYYVRLFKRGYLLSVGSESVAALLAQPSHTGVTVYDLALEDDQIAELLEELAVEAAWDAYYEALAAEQEGES